MITRQDLTPIGKLHRTHGLKGELNAVLDIDREYLSDGNPAILDIDGAYVPFFADEVRAKGSTSCLVRFEGIDSEEEARSLVNKTVYAQRETLAGWLDIDPCEIHADDDMVGYTLHDIRSGRDIGIVTRIDDSTANLLFVVDGDAGELFIPVAEDWIGDIDDDRRVIEMELPEGLVDLNA